MDESKKYIVLASGRTIEVEDATKGNQYDILCINLQSLSFVEATILFANPDNTSTLLYKEHGNDTIYRGYTNLIEVGISPFYFDRNILLIQLERLPEEETTVELNESIEE